MSGADGRSCPATHQGLAPYRRRLGPLPDRRLLPALPRDKFTLLGVSEGARLAAVAPAHRPFLSFHRDRVFIRPDSQD